MSELQPDQSDIMKAVYENMQPDDRYPSEVIIQAFDGDVNAYLEAMAQWHGLFEPAQPLEHEL